MIRTEDASRIACNGPPICLLRIEALFGGVPVLPPLEDLAHENEKFKARQQNKAGTVLNRHDLCSTSSPRSPAPPMV